MSTLTASRPFLDLIPGRYGYTIPPVSGEKLIIETEFYHERAQSVYLNPQFPSKRRLPTLATPVMVFRVNPKEFGPHVMLRKLFYEIADKLEEICLTEHQIISFIESKPDFLGQANNKTLFLIHGQRGFSVACAQSYFHYDDSPVELVPMDFAEPLYVEKYHLNLVIPKDSTINILKS